MSLRVIKLNTLTMRWRQDTASTMTTTITVQGTLKTFIPEDEYVILLLLLCTYGIRFVYVLILDLYAKQNHIKIIIKKENVLGQSEDMAFNVAVVDNRALVQWIMRRWLMRNCVWTYSNSVPKILYNWRLSSVRQFMNLEETKNLLMSKFKDHLLHYHGESVTTK